MVRLRKDRWYSAEGQRQVRRRVQTQVAGTRRVVSMVFLLALVLVLMQRARDPRYISDFFAALGVPLEQTPTGVEEGPGKNLTPVPATPENVAPNLPRDATGPSLGAGGFSVGLTEGGQGAVAAPPVGNAAWRSTCRDLVARALRQATDEQVRCMAWMYFQVPADAQPAVAAGSSSMTSDFEIVDSTLLTPGVDVPTALDAVRAMSLQQVAELGQSLGPDDGPWRDPLERFNHQWELLWSMLLPESPPAGRDSSEPGGRGTIAAGGNDLPNSPATVQVALDGEVEQAVTDWLDQRLMAMLVESSPWKRREGIAFWRLLQRGGRVGRPNSADRWAAPELTTVQLLAESEQWKGRPVQFRGTVRRCDVVRKACLGFGVHGYAVAWLRGADRSNQPVAVYVPLAVAPDALRRFSPGDRVDVAVDALGGKKLAYAAQAGLQITATLFARRVAVQGRVAGAASGPETLDPRWWVPYLIAMLVSGIVAVAVVWTLLKRRSSGRTPTPTSSRQGPSVNSLVCAWALFVGGWGSLAEGQDAVPPATAPPWQEADAMEKKLELARQMVDQSIAMETMDRFTAAALSPAARPPSDVVLKVLHLVERFRVEELPLDVELVFGAEDRWALRRGVWPIWCQEVSAAPLADNQRDWFDPEGQRQVFAMRANLRVTDAEQTTPAEVSSAAAEAAEAATRTGGEVPVWALQAPAFWLAAQSLYQPARIDGVAWVDRTDGRVVALFCRRPAWIVPKELVPACRPPLPTHWRPLAEGGWDLSWIDSIRRNNQRPIDRDEAPALLNLLRIVDRARPSTEQQVQPTEDPLKVFEAGEEPWLQPIRWQVRLVSGAVVEVEDPDQRRWLGSDRYFQLDGFVELGDRRIRYRTEDMAAGDAIEFVGEFPLTILVRTPGELVPPEARRGEMRGWEIGRYAEVEGRFYRMWAYQSELMEQRSSGGRQVAPLVVAHAVRPTIPPVRSTAGSVWFTYALGLALMLILGYVLYSAATNMPRRRRRVKK